MSRSDFLAFLLFTIVGTASGQGDDLFFNADFNGSGQGTLTGQSLDPDITEGLRFGPSDHSQALKVEAGTTISYDLGDTFSGEAGALEVRFRPDFPQSADSPARDVLRLKGKNDVESVLSFNPVGLRWILTIAGNGWRKELTLWHGRVKADEWSHVLFVWNEPDHSFAIYHNGKWVETIDYGKRFEAPVLLEIGGGQDDSGISVDEVALSNRAFSHAQATFLAESSGGEGKRFARVSERLASDDQALAERRALLAKLEGKVGRVYPNRGVEPQQGVYPEGVIGVGIRPEDIGKIDLSQFSGHPLPTRTAVSNRARTVPAHCRICEQRRRLCRMLSGRLFCRETGACGHQMLHDGCLGPL